MTYNVSEPKMAFLYKAPNENIKELYSDIFKIKKPLRTPLIKLLFDKLFAIIILLFCLPIILLLYLSNLIEGIIIPENKGPLFFYYNAVSRGKILKNTRLE